MIKLSDLLFGKKIVVAGSQIWDNDHADCAQIRFYPKDDNTNWYMMIIGEDPSNHLYIECNQCGNVMVDRKFMEDAVVPSLETPSLCFHCRQYQQHGERDD